MSFEEFKQYCVDYANKATVQYGSYDVPVQGINGFAPNGGEGTLGFEQVMPGQDSDTLLYDAYDGSKVNYTDPLWIKYRAETDYFFDNGLVESMTAEDKAAIFGAEDAYLFEKGVDMPICAVRNEFYIDYLTGLIITEESKINFIKEGIKTKRFFTKDVDLNIYIIEEEISKNHVLCCGSGAGLHSHHCCEPPACPAPVQAGSAGAADPGQIHWRSG